MEKGFDYQLHTFDSGLRLVTVPMASARTATVLVLVSCGSKYETKELSGVSHFLEHMMFRGTEKRPGKLDIVQGLDAIGASYNAFTSKETTGYYIKAAASKLDTIMDVVFDIFLNSKLEQAALEVERGPIIEELRMRRDDPQSHIGTIFEELLYGDQPAGREIGGTIETIQNMQAPDLRQYFDEHYVAKNTVIAVAGGIDAEQVKAKVEEAFANIRQAERAIKPPTIQAQTAPIVKAFAKDVEQVYVQLGVRSPGMFDEKRYPLALLASIMGGGMGSRLSDEIREKRGLAYYIGAANEQYTDSGYFEVSAGLNPSKVHEGIKVIVEQLAKVADSGVTEQELQRVKDQAEGRLAFMLESTGGVAQDYGGSVLFYDRVLTPEEELGKIRLVTQDDIKAVCRDIFRNEGLNLAVIGPNVADEQFKDILSFT